MLKITISAQLQRIAVNYIIASVAVCMQVFIQLDVAPCSRSTLVMCGATPGSFEPLIRCSTRQTSA
jgi:hypothetical protein